MYQQHESRKNPFGQLKFENRFDEFEILLDHRVTNTNEILQVRSHDTKSVHINRFHNCEPHD